MYFFRFSLDYCAGHLVPETSSGNSRLFTRSRLRGNFLSHLDLYLNPARQFQFHQCVDGFGRRTVDVQQPFVGAQLELFTCLFIDMRRTQNRKNLFVGGQRDWSCYHCARGFHGLYDFLGGFVHQVVIVGFEFYSYFLTHGI